MAGTMKTYVQYQQTKADKYGYVHINWPRQSSTSPRFAKSIVLAKIAYDTISLLMDRQEPIVTHVRLDATLPIREKTQATVVIHAVTHLYNF